MKFEGEPELSVRRGGNVRERDRREEELGRENNVQKNCDNCILF